MAKKDEGAAGENLTKVWGFPDKCPKCGSNAVDYKIVRAMGETKGGVVKSYASFKCKFCGHKQNGMVGLKYGKKQKNTGPNRVREGHDRDSEGEAEVVGGDSVGDI